MAVARVLAVLILVLVLVGTALPSGVRAADTQSAGCDALGLQMDVPADWSMISACPSMNAITAAFPADHSVLLQDTVERHGFWNAARATSSIRHDLLKRINNPGAVTQLHAPIFQTLTLHGRRFWGAVGSAKSIPSPGVVPFWMAVYELEAFESGHLFKFMASVILTVDDSKTNAQRVTLMDRCWSTIQIVPAQ